ncbi:hypothetical protein [Yeosuana sp.]|uniref:hypothetical protein n=1 Tax=Yeosuana sp. TaxID=2529388 RepID=UPI004054AEC2
MHVWNSITSQLDDVLKLPIEETLSQTIIWLESKRFQYSSQQKLNELSLIYNFFVELVFSNKKQNSIEIRNSEEFSYLFFNTLKKHFQGKKLLKEHPVSLLLNSIAAWINLNDGVISPYSFELDINPIQENELIYFYSTPQSYYNWCLNGIRYEVNRINYMIKGSIISDHLFNKENIKIAGKTEKTIQLNINLLEKFSATLAIMDDLACESFNLSNGKKINFKEVLDPLIVYSMNRFDRYENGLAKHSENTTNWFQAYQKLFFESEKKGTQNFPYLLTSQSEYKEHNQIGLNKIDVASNEVIELFGWSPKKTREFNRFKISYDVWLNPFLKLDNFLFCPMMFFANNFWFYPFAQAALFQKTDRSETEQMEKKLANLFKTKGWNVKTPSNIESNILSGDVDIFVEDGESLLLIQLKRTYFRLDAKDAYYEGHNIDKKAAHQLNEAEEFLKNENKIFQMKHKTTKWIVSNSFENVGKKINNCIKINYFDIINALSNETIKTLNDFIFYLENDTVLKSMKDSYLKNDMPPEVRVFFDEILKPISIIQSDRYKHIIFSEDVERTATYSQLYDTAMELQQNDEKYEAIEVLKKRIDLYPNDAVARGAIANILADEDIEDYKMAMQEFEKALEILPNDPFIKRNYAIALRENNQIYKALLIFLELYQMFPLLDDFKVLFEENFKFAQNKKLINKAEINELNKKMGLFN